MDFSPSRWLLLMVIDIVFRAICFLPFGLVVLLSPVFSFFNVLLLFLTAIIVLKYPLRPGTAFFTAIAITNVLFFLVLLFFEYRSSGNVKSYICEAPGICDFKDSVVEWSAGRFLVMVGLLTINVLPVLFVWLDYRFSGRENAR